MALAEEKLVSLLSEDWLIEKHDVHVRPLTFSTLYYVLLGASVGCVEGILDISGFPIRILHIRL